MRNFLLLILFISSLLPRDIIAILELEQKGLSKQEAEILTDRLTTKLISIGKYQVVERNNMDKILKEQKFQNSGCTDSECAVEIGQLLNTDYIVMGSVNKFGSTWTLDARLIDVGLGKGIISAEYTMKGEIDGLITTGITSIAQQLSGMGSNEFTTELSYPVSGTKTLSKEKAVISLAVIGDVRSVVPLIELLEHNFAITRSWQKRTSKEIIDALGKLGDVRAIEPLAKGLDVDLSVDEKTATNEAISNLLDGLDIGDKERKNLLRFLVGEDQGMRVMGVSMLRGMS